MNRERLTFQVAGIWKLTLMLRDEQTNSIWAHTEGVAVSGPLKGTVLEPYPVYQTVWEDWLDLHPGSEVLVWPEKGAHRDGRHGHGARDYLGRPGVRAGRGFGLKPENLDDRLSENELVLGVSHSAGDTAYPLRMLQQARGVSNELLGEDPVVVWCSALDSQKTGVFSRSLDGTGVLTFRNQKGIILDDQTDSTWNVEGEATSGSLKGKVLEPLSSVLLKWHVWSKFHPDTDIRCFRNRLIQEDMDGFSEFLMSLEEAGLGLLIEGMVLKAHLPNLAARGLIFRVGDDRLMLFEFESALGSREYQFANSHCVRIGRFVLQSDPERRFEDAAQLKPLPEDEVAWSRLLESDEFVSMVAGSLPDTGSEEPDGQLGIDRVLESLEKQGYGVAIREQLECRRMPPEAINGFELTLAGDPFLVYRFNSQTSAEEFGKKIGSCAQEGCYVFRSDPPVQYKNMVLKSISLDSSEIEWSKLLTDRRFNDALELALSSQAE